MKVRHGPLYNAQRINPNEPDANVPSETDGLLEICRFQVGYLDALRPVHVLHLSLRGQKSIPIFWRAPAMAECDVWSFRAFLARLYEANVSAVAKLQIQKACRNP